MNIIVACEESQEVTKAFRVIGHEAFSCDLVEPSGGVPQWHLQMDVFDALKVRHWDMMIAHPPCDHLAVSGARWFKEKQADGRQQKAIEFFLALANSSIEKICIENPISIMSTLWRKPDQIIQPWQFGHPESKATCLWLKGLPLLKPTNILTKTSKYWNNQTPSGQNKLGPSPDRKRLRSKTYSGVAYAMASQWGNLCG